MRLRKKILEGLIAVTQRLGTKLKDADGNVLCRAFLTTWKGNVHLLGVPNHVQLKPVPLRQARLSYWHQSMVWEQAEAPNFPRLKPAPPADTQASVCHVIICHLAPSLTGVVFKKWREMDPAAEVLIAYGGSRQNFEALDPSVNAVYVPDSSLRTVDHPRERQQYSGVFREAASWLANHGRIITHVHVAEFDFVPTVTEPGRHLVDALVAEDADVAGFGLVDLTGTVHPQNRHQLADHDFRDFLKSLSPRELSDRLLTMLGCSSIWTRGCFDEVTRLESVPPVYLEVALPTLAHHLGYRVRPMPAQQEKFITFKGDSTSRIDRYRAAGSWFVHPCKQYWLDMTSSVAPAADQVKSLGSEKKRLLLIGHTYGASVNRAKAAALGESYDVMVGSPDFEGIEMMGRDGSCQDYEVPGATYEYRRLRRWPRSSGFTTCVAKGLGKVFREWNPDIVLCEAEPWAVMRWQARLLSWLQKSNPLFVEFTWENVPRPGLKGRFLKWIYRFAASTTDGVVCGNKGAETLFLKAGLDPSRILRTGQLGVAPEEHPEASSAEKSAWRESIGLPANTFIIGFCGRLVEEKGVWDLLNAVARLRDQDGTDCSLVFLGTGILEKELKTAIAGKPWVRILPPVPHAEVPSIINKFDLFVLPSKPQTDPARGIWEEQFGHVLLEAMMCGVPCIGSNSGGIPEVLDRADVIFPAGDVDALKHLLARLSSDLQRVRVLGSEQKELTLQKWTHLALAGRYVAFIESLRTSEGK